VFHAARIRAGWTSTGFSDALEMAGSTNGNTTTANMQTTQDLCWKIVDKVSLNNLITITIQWLIIISNDNRKYY
jgi:hypothetical protein